MLEWDTSHVSRLPQIYSIRSGVAPPACPTYWTLPTATAIDFPGHNPDGSSLSANPATGHVLDPGDIANDLKAASLNHLEPPCSHRHSLEARFANLIGDAKSVKPQRSQLFNAD